MDFFPQNKPTDFYATLFHLLDFLMAIGIFIP
jgi:hypothetical protein